MLMLWCRLPRSVREKWLQRCHLPGLSHILSLIFFLKCFLRCSSSVDFNASTPNRPFSPLYHCMCVWVISLVLRYSSKHRWYLSLALPVSNTCMHIANILWSYKWEWASGMRDNFCAWPLTSVLLVFSTHYNSSHLEEACKWCLTWSYIFWLLQHTVWLQCSD